MERRVIGACAGVGEGRQRCGRGVEGVGTAPNLFKRSLVECRRWLLPPPEGGVKWKLRA